ncbi:hypothetical protein DF186_15530, partial [Enterococcus hirae]
FSSDAKQGRIKFHISLKEHYDMLKKLTWKIKQIGEVKTSKTIFDDYFDSSLYVFREYLKFSNPVSSEPKKLSPEEEYWAKQKQRLQKENKR